MTSRATWARVFESNTRKQGKKSYCTSLFSKLAKQTDHSLLIFVYGYALHSIQANGMRNRDFLLTDWDAEQSL